LDPLPEFADAFGVRLVIGIEEISERRKDRYPKDRCKQEAFIHSCIVSSFPESDQKVTLALNLTEI
jgi:hypothetical protein